MNVVLGIDLGTSYFKAGIVDKSGKLLGLGRAAVPVDRSVENRWELTADNFWITLKTAVNTACAMAGADISDICSVSYSSQANSFLMLDSEHRPLTPLILWPDTRYSETDPVLESFWSMDDYPEKAGMDMRGGGFCIAKLRWFQKKQPGLWARVRHIMTISDYFSFALTGKAVGDSGTASLLGIYDIKAMKWWPEALAHLGIPEEYLSRPYLPGTPKGRLAPAAGKYLGLRSGISFSVGGLDHHIAALGAGAGLIADTSESTGTVLACYNSPTEFTPDSISCLGPSVIPGEYYRLKFNDNGGRGLEWYRENFAPELSLADLDGMAADVPPGSEGLSAMSEVFRADDLSRFYNRKEIHGHGHYARAIMESTAVSLLDLLSGLSGEGKIRRVLATGGGAKSALWLGIKADITGADFITTTSPEPAAYGAAMFAAIAAGWFGSYDEIARKWIGINKEYKPDSKRAAEYRIWLDNYRRMESGKK